MIGVKRQMVLTDVKAEADAQTSESDHLTTQVQDFDDFFVFAEFALVILDSLQPSLPSSVLKAF